MSQGQLLGQNKKLKQNTRLPSTGQGSELHTKLCFSNLNIKEQFKIKKEQSNSTQRLFVRGGNKS